MNRLARTVLICELQRLLRDRRALFAAIVLPMLLYPLLFLGTERLQGHSREALSTRPIEVLVLREGFSPELLSQVREALTREELHLVWIEEGAPAPSPDEAQELLTGRGAQVLLAARPRAPAQTALRVVGESPHSLPRIVLGASSSDELGAEGARRVTVALESLAERLELERLEQALGRDPGAAQRPEELDLASADDARGLALGRLLPLIAVLALLSGGSMAALDAFAGEREARTLETLLVQPVPGRDLARGKFGAVLLTGLAALFGNGLSLVLCAASGLGDLPGAVGGGGLPPLRLALATLTFLPAAVLLCALLALACAHARSYREGQHYVLPLTLLSLVPAGIASVPSVELDGFWALVPVAGPALALRDALVGRLAAAPALLVLGAGVLWAALAMRALGSALDGERLLAVGDGSAPRDRATSRAALVHGVAAVLAVYLLGGWLQAQDPVLGLAATLWLLLPLLALSAARSAVRRGGLTWRRALGLGPGRRVLLHGLGAVLLAPGLAALVRRLVELQSEILPLPGADADLALPALLEQPLGLLLFLVALSPGLWEELLFRGAIQSGLARDLRPARVVLWQALLFGAVHASVHRFLPTALLGGLLALLTLRARCILPAVLLHAAYNGLALYGGLREGGLTGAEPLLEWARAGWLPWLALPGLALLALAGRDSQSDPQP